MSRAFFLALSVLIADFFCAGVIDLTTDLAVGFLAAGFLLGDLGIYLFPCILPDLPERMLLKCFLTTSNLR